MTGVATELADELLDDATEELLEETAEELLDEATEELLDEATEELLDEATDELLDEAAAEELLDAATEELLDEAATELLDDALLDEAAGAGELSPPPLPPPHAATTKDRIRTLADAAFPIFEPEYMTPLLDFLILTVIPPTAARPSWKPLMVFLIMP